jgi:large subunit ribosomal protein L17
MLFRNQVTDLLRYDKMTTTEVKAREVRSLAEKMITLAKDGTLHARRQAAAFLTDEAVLTRLFKELGPRYADRAGGYTRMSKLGPRQGDAAPMAIIEMIK